MKNTELFNIDQDLISLYKISTPLVMGIMMIISKTLLLTVIVSATVTNILNLQQVLGIFSPSVLLILNFVVLQRTVNCSLV